VVVNRFGFSLRSKARIRIVEEEKGNPRQEEKLRKANKRLSNASWRSVLDTRTLDLLVSLLETPKFDSRTIQVEEEQGSASMLLHDTHLVERLPIQKTFLLSSARRSLVAAFSLLFDALVWHLVQFN
jgi:hypothetical protein